MRDVLLLLSQLLYINYLRVIIMENKLRLGSLPRIFFAFLFGSSVILTALHASNSELVS